MSDNKWSDPTYHALEAMRELSAAENHLIQYINQMDNNEELESLLIATRDIRKKVEDDIYGQQ